jgi:hypothetical protein
VLHDILDAFANILSILDGISNWDQFSRGRPGGLIANVSSLPTPPIQHAASSVTESNELKRKPISRAW